MSSTTAPIPLKPLHGTAGACLALLGAYALRVSPVPSASLLEALPLSLMAALVPVGLVMAVFGTLVPGLVDSRVALRHLPSSPAGKLSLSLHACLYWLAFLVPMLPHQGWIAHPGVLAAASFTLLAPVVWRFASAISVVEPRR